jgi:molecular chaperone HscB
MTANLDFSRDHFDLFGLPMSFALDDERLDKAYRDIQAEIHPDKFAHAGESEQRLAMQWTTKVNEAYQTLKKPFERARYLLALNGVDAMDAKNTSMPADFLMQQMEWREALEDARSDRDMAALESLEKTLRDDARSLRAQLGVLLDEQHDYPGAGETLRKLRFMDKLQEEIGNAYEDLE